jgi:hypothetical protein
MYIHIFQPCHLNAIGPDARENLPAIISVNAIGKHIEIEEKRKE